MAAKKGKLSKSQRAEISRRNLRKAFAARGVKASFEPAAEPKRRAKKAKKAAKPVAEPKRRRPVAAEPARKRRVRRVSEPAPAFVFEPAPRRRRARKQVRHAPVMRAYDPARLSKEDRMRRMALGYVNKGKPVPPHMVQYLKPEDYSQTVAAPALPAKRKAGRPKMPTTQLKHPRRVKAATGAPKRGRGRPKMPTGQLKHPRRVKRTSGSMPTARGVGRGHGKGIIQSGVYSNPKTGQVIAIRRVYTQKNPVFKTKHMLAGAGGLVIGIIGADLLDRFLATMAPDANSTALRDTKAISAIQSKVNATRMAASAGGAVVGFGGAYLLRNKSAMASYALGGFGLGFGVKFLTQLVTDIIMPVIFKVEDRKADTTANRLYPDKQGYSDVSTQTTPAKTSTPSTQAGVGAPRVYRLPPAKRVMQTQFGARRQMYKPPSLGAQRPAMRMPDFGPVARQRVGTAGTVSGCSGGGSSCASHSCNYPFERYDGTPAQHTGMSPLPASINECIPQAIPPARVPEQVNPPPQMQPPPEVEVDVTPTGEVALVQSQPSQNVVDINLARQLQLRNQGDLVALMARASGVSGTGSRRRYR